jgi:4a-hydroxytetrahydrobiopterin dehydratase
MKLLDFDIEAKSFSNKSDRSRPDILSELKIVLDKPPIVPSKVEWTLIQNPERLSRSFEFEDFRKQFDFIDELMIYQERISHHAKITIDYRTVTVETFTHNVDAVTEIDLSLTKFCDLLFEDVKHYYAADGVDDEKFQ